MIGMIFGTFLSWTWSLYGLYNSKLYLGPILLTDAIGWILHSRKRLLEVWTLPTWFLSNIVIWTYLVVIGFWEEVLTMMNCTLSVPVQPSIHACLLDLMKNIIPTVAEPTLVSLFLFYTLEKVLTHLPFYKDTYINRGCSKKYGIVWSKWPHLPTME